MSMQQPQPPTSKRRPRTRRADPRQLPELRLTEGRRRILQLLSRYRYLTPRLLAAVYGDGSGAHSHVRHELRELYDRELVQRFYFSTRPSGLGSDEHAYTITPEGAQAVLDPEQYEQTRRSIYNRMKEKQNYPHHLAISTLQLILDNGVQPWQLEDFYSDHASAETQIEAEIDGRRLGPHWPDGTAIIRFPSGQRTLYLFEVDRERKENQRISDRFLAYALHLTDNLEEIRRARRVNGAVSVFVVPSEGELERLTELAIGVFEKWARGPRPQFLFWNSESWYEDREEAQTRAGVRGSRVVRVLRSPQKILSSECVTTLTGKARRLVQG